MALIDNPFKVTCNDIISGLFTIKDLEIDPYFVIWHMCDNKIEVRVVVRLPTRGGVVLVRAELSLGRDPRRSPDRVGSGLCAVTMDLRDLHLGHEV